MSKNFCRECGEKIDKENLSEPCPNCGSKDRIIKSADTLTVRLAHIKSKITKTYEKIKFNWFWLGLTLLIGLISIFMSFLGVIGMVINLILFIICIFTGYKGISKIKDKETKIKEKKDSK